MKYKTIEELFVYIEGPMRHRLPLLYTKYKKEMYAAQGSQHNHQAWAGGYIDHVAEVMNIARMLHQAMNAIRPLPFSVSDALIVLFLHDIEKIFPNRIAVQSCDRPSAKKHVREMFLHEEGIGSALTIPQWEAIQNVESEQDYDNTRRGMSELAAFCHLCDVTSARIWHNRPLDRQEKWGWRESLTVGDNELWGV